MGCYWSVKMLSIWVKVLIFNLCGKSTLCSGLYYDMDGKIKKFMHSNLKDFKVFLHGKEHGLWKLSILRLKGLMKYDCQVF